MNEVERQHQAYTETPAGRVRSRLGCSEQRDVMAESAFVSETKIRREAAYGRPLYEEEERALRFAAELRTRTTSQARPSPRTSWDWAAEMRWGVESPPPQDAALGSLSWIAVPR